MRKSGDINIQTRIKNIPTPTITVFSIAWKLNRKHF